MNIMLSAWLEMISLTLIVIGALNWGLVGMFNLNIVQLVAENTFAILEPIVYVLVGVAAIVHIFSRDYYLPFLGKTVYPCGSLTPKTPQDADASATIKVSPYVNVIYWAAEPNAQIVDNPWVAYSEYENTGVARSDENGVAVLKVRTPAAYKVPRTIFDKTLKPHIHYRTCSMSGMLGRVETVYI
jgi:uncharacterized membrane protein YuzA (DUF378 family)